MVPSTQELLAQYVDLRDNYILELFMTVQLFIILLDTLVGKGKSPFCLPVVVETSIDIST